jgi:hypothetical protein
MSDTARVVPLAERSIETGYPGPSDHAMYWERCGWGSDPAVIFLHRGRRSTQAEVRASSLRACGDLGLVTVS